MDKYWVNTKQDEDKQTKNTTQKIENMSNTDPTITRGWSRVLAKGKQFLPRKCDYL
jgi:hypothetical protein